MIGGAPGRQGRFDTSQVLVETGAADLHLGMTEAEIGEAAHLLRQRGEVIPGIGVAAARVDAHLGCGEGSGAEPAAEKSMERQSGCLGGGIPQRHVERAHGDAALAMATRLLARHHRLPGLERVEAAIFPDKPVGGL